MRRVSANQMVKLRQPGPFRDTHWKVTARYIVYLPGGRQLPCVRVRMCGGGNLVMHYSRDEFTRLFIEQDIVRAAVKAAKANGRAGTKP